ncbi:cytochrome P450 [Protaetiibacter larvae]|uniref:Cytochrome P450 n=1 Tax=Protaetiibacter larvae TaxID=2592654 RepID=A0A5C1Y6T4_9MICO|nr:cytochrome P450 [Protaetiibacter larvae]QEO09506.1 cytochrome P450 [Protaetiibacter larvae]
MSRRAADDTATRRDAAVVRAAHPVAFPLVSAIPGPVRRVPGLGVVVKDAALLRGVLMDGEHFSKTGKGASSELWTPVLGPRVLVNMHGPEHLALRRQLAPLFAPSFVDGFVAESLGALTASLASALAAGEEVDLVAHARRAASRVVSRLVGLDEGDFDDASFARISTIIGTVTLARPRLRPRPLAEARAVFAELSTHAARAYAGDESTVPGRMRALGLDEREAIGAVGAFVLAGTETIVSYLPRLAALLIDSGWLARVASDRALADAAIAEGLRVTTPTPVMLRSTLAPTTIGEVPVRAGDRVILGTYWADTALGAFDPDAHPAASLKQLWFGAGVHFCIGAPLAMAQIRQTFEALLAHPGLRIMRRRAARGVLIPAYAELVVRA